MGKKQHERHLTPRDADILKSVIHYRALTNRLLFQACFESDLGMKNVNRVLLRLERRGLLRRVTFDVGHSYFAPTSRTFVLLEKRAYTPRSISEQALPCILATATYCIASGQRRLTAPEFRKRFPELWRHGMGASSYVLANEATDPHLELLLFDRGGMANRIRSRVRRAIAQRINIPEFCSLMGEGGFHITVLTGTVEHQAKIQRRVSSGEFDPIEISVVVLPDLKDLLV